MSMDYVSWRSGHSQVIAFFIIFMLFIHTVCDSKQYFIIPLT